MRRDGGEVKEVERGRIGCRGRRMNGMRRDELNRMACGWLVSGGIATNVSSPWGLTP